MTHSEAEKDHTLHLDERDQYAKIHHRLLTLLGLVWKLSNDAFLDMDSRQRKYDIWIEFEEEGKERFCVISYKTCQGVLATVGIGLDPTNVFLMHLLPSSENWRRNNDDDDRYLKLASL